MTKIKSRHVYLFASLVAGLIAVIFTLISLAWILHWETPRNRDLKREGNEIIVQIEMFKNEHRRLPENLRELGLPESEAGPLYYNKSKDGVNYTVSFSGSTIGESTFYNSEDKIWYNF